MNGQPASEGTYTLQDGTTMQVDSTGSITQVVAPEAMASTEYTLQDGSKISADKLDVGGKVMVGDQPAADGDYTLQDGSKITVANGAITVVTPKAAEAPAKMTKEQVQQAYDDVTATTDAAGQLPKLVVCVKSLMDYNFGWMIDDPNYNPQEEVQDAQQVADAIAAVTTLSQQFQAKDDEVKELKKLVEKQSETITAALQLMTELAELPVADPPEGVQRKVIFTGEVQKTKKAGVAKYAAAAEKLAEQNKN